MLALRNFVIKNRHCVLRNYASRSKLIDVTEDNKTGISILSMARPPVNSLNLELLRDLKTSLLEAQEKKSKGVILTSSLPTVFSAGLDITEMYKPDLIRVTDFWKTLQDTWLILYGLEVPTAAAINGASPAGGCLLATSCEYRAFVQGKHTIGLNETQLGIVAPKWFQDPFIKIIGYRQAELALLRGTLFPPNKALDIGLVDVITMDKAEAIKNCENYILSFDKIPKQARKMTKLKVRQKALSWLQKNRESDLKEFVQFVQLPSVQSNLQNYMETLKQK